MNNVKPKLGYDYLTVSKSLLSFADDKVKENDIYKSFQQHVAVLLNMGLRAIARCTENDQKTYIKMYKELGGFNNCYRKAGGKYFIEGVMFALFPSKMVKIYKLLK